MAAGACGTVGEETNEVAATDLSEIMPEGLFEALENVANPPADPAPDPAQGESLAEEIYETLVPAQADNEQELSEEELLRLRDEAFVDFSRCIRDEGFPDFPDIDSSQIVDQASFLRAMQEAGVSFTQPGLAPALQTCASVFSELIALAPQQDTNVQQVEQEENAVAFSQCMRDQGLDDFPDPDFGQYPNTGFPGQGDGDGGGVTPEIQAALRVCLPVFGGAEPNEAAAPPTPDDPTPAAQVTASSPQSTSNAQSSVTSTQAPQPAGEGSTPAPGPTVSASVLRDTEELNTAEVVRRDLIDTEEFSGTLGYGDPEALHTNTSGVVTGRLPTEGDVLGVGDVLFEVNSYPVVLLRGERPMYRPFERDMEEGPDVEQLEQALADMRLPGYEDMTIDEDFTRVTEDLVEEWQNRLGVEKTGVIDMGFVVFIEAPIRISSVNVIEGQTISAQAAAFTITGQDQEIVSNLDPADAEIVNRLDRVEVELPDGRVTPGAVAEVARVATRLTNPQTGAPGDPTIEVIIVLLDGEASARFDAAPVDWTITKEVTPNALVVPASALIATVDGGFSVEVVQEGATTLVPVEVGTFVDAFVEITGGDLEVGDLVRIP
ncbi:efflux RND transporter periplasmic adaptor subunit [Candidatus Poriferisocius sp.]|uniref:efflux RND transporter periplasmic adaptor subunit n=1 Tax=Candidatus Poriferisocius sp. TaxID=3101276 RepID=UPI003B5A9BA1